MKKIVWAVVIVVVAALAAWQLGVFGGGKQATEATPPPVTEAPAQPSTTPAPATTEAPAQPSTTEPAPATPPATTTTQ